MNEMIEITMTVGITSSRRWMMYLPMAGLQEVSITPSGCVENAPGGSGREDLSVRP